MKLTAELIFNKLSEHVEVTYTITSDRSKLVDRPVLFDPAWAPSDHLCILHSAELPAGRLSPGTYVVLGEPRESLTGEGVEFLLVPGSLQLNKVFNTIQGIFDYYDTWDREMTELIEGDKGYNELLECATRYLDCPISIVDDDFSIIAFSDNKGSDFRDVGDTTKVSSSIMSELISDPHFSSGLHNNDVYEFFIGGELFFAYNIKKGTKYLGRVSLYYTSKLSRGACSFLFKILAHKVEVMLRKFGSFLLHKETLTSLRELLLSCLKSEPLEKQYIEFRLNENGWSFADEYVLIRLQPEFRHEWQLHANYVIPLMERQWPGVCAVECDNYIVVLLNQTIFEAKCNRDFMQELAYFLRDGLMLAGISRSFKGLDNIPTYYRQTDLAVTFGKERHPMNWYYCFDDYALGCWIVHGIFGFSPEQICSKALLKLLRYDAENNTDYYTTLRVFFGRKFSYTHAAEDLYIHRTTLIKRIERIVELTKIDLDDTDTLLYSDLSFRFLDKIIATQGNPLQQ